MSKVISFRIRLEGSKDILAEIDKIGKKLREALGKNVDGKALDDIKRASQQLGNQISTAGTSISDLTKRLTQLRSEGKSNTVEYQNLTKQVAELRAQQSSTTQEIRRQQKQAEASINLQRLLDGEIKASDLSQKKFFEAINSGLDKADPRYQELINDYARLRAEEKAFRQGLKEQERAFESTKFAAGSYRALNAELGKLRASYRDLSEAERNGLAGKQSLKRIQELDKELKKLDANLGNYQRNVGNYERAWRGAGAALAAVGVGIGLSEISRAVQDSIKTFADFEQQIKRVEIASGATEAQIARLEKQARELGATTIFTAQQVGELQENFARLGFSPEEIEAVTEATLELAITTGEGLPEAAEVAAGTLRGYRLQADETARVTNVMALSFSSSALNLERFRESQKLVAPIAAQLGVDVENTTAALGKLADNQISGSLAGTALRNILAELGNENSKLSQRLGIVVNDSSSFQEALTRLSQSSIDTAEAQELVGNRAFGSLLILKENAEQIQSLSGELGNASEAYARLGDGSIVPLTEELKESGESFEVLSAGQRGAAIASNTLQADMKALGSAVSEASIRLGELVQGSLRGLIQSITRAIPIILQGLIRFIETLRAIPSFIRENQVEIAALATALVALNTQAIATAANTLRQAAAQRAVTIATKAQAVATRVLNAVLKANPIGLVVAAVAGLVAIFARLYKTSQTLRSGIAGTFEALKTIVRNVVGGLVKQLTGFGNILKGVFTLDLETIKKGAEQYASGVGDVFLRAGKGAGDAFTKGFNEKTTADLNKAIDEAIEDGSSQLGDKVNEEIVKALEKGQITNAQADAFQDRLIKGLEPKGEISTDGLSVELPEIPTFPPIELGEDSKIGLSEKEKEALEERKKAIENIRKLEQELIANEFDQKRSQAQAGAQGDIAGLVGDPEQIRRQTALIQSQLALSIAEIEKARIDSFGKSITKAKQEAAQQISQLTGSEQEIATQAATIRQTLATEIQTITSSRTESLDSALAELETNRQREIEALTGSEEEITANTQVINNAYQQATNELTESRKAVISEQETELFQIRQQIIQQFGGEIAESLRTSSAEELAIAKQAVEQRIAVLDSELEATRQRIEQRASLERQALSNELQAGVGPKRAKEIADRLKKIDEELKASLLQAERDTAKKRLEIAQEIVPNSLKLANDLANKEVEINAKKNAEILAQEKKRAEEEKAIKQALQDAAFTIAEGFIGIAIEQEKQRSEAFFNGERERVESSADQRTQALEADYQKRIELAQGNTQEVERLEAELAEKRTQIEAEAAEKAEAINRKEAKKNKQIAIKEALINAALAATKTLASLGFTPAAIPALIALAAATAVQLGTIRSQQFEQGSALGEFTKGMTVRLFEAGNALGTKGKSQQGTIAKDLSSFAGRAALVQSLPTEVKDVAYKLSSVGSAMSTDNANTKQSASAFMQSTGYADAVSRWDNIAAQQKEVAANRDQLVNMAYEVRNNKGNFVVDRDGRITRKESLVDISRQSSAALPAEGVVRGPSHDEGGVKATYKGNLIEVEGGEYLLRNGPETYIINKKSTRQFKPELNRMRGKQNKFDPAKRIGASMINAYRGFGVKFQTGAALLRDSLPVQPPQQLQNINQQITRQELQTSLSSVTTGLQDQAKAIDAKTEQLNNAIRQQVDAVNSRIDRIVVINDPEEVVRVGGQQIQTQNNAQL